MTSTACDDQFTPEPQEPVLNPRYLPRSYPEMLQDILDLRDRFEKFDGTDARNMAYALDMVATLARDQLERLTRNAGRRMIGGRHEV